ncbi:MAG: fibronectin type III domain-containing protein, partial [Gammaproteobacteria bacterium]|nr:fibronectin type III domain-containing protein [Gammaproteobacteria bacterium]
MTVSLVGQSRTEACSRRAAAAILGFDAARESRADPAGRRAIARALGLDEAPADVPASRHAVARAINLALANKAARNLELVDASILRWLAPDWLVPTRYKVRTSTDGGATWSILVLNLDGLSVTNTDHAADSRYEVTAMTSAGPAQAVVLEPAGDTPGRVRINPRRAPSGSTLTATLIDPDNVVASTITYRWQVSLSGRWISAGSNSTSRSFVYGGTFARFPLRCRITYTDDFGAHTVDSATIRTGSRLLNDAVIDSASIPEIPEVGEAGNVRTTVAVEGIFDGNPETVWSVASGVGSYDAGTNIYRTGDIGEGDDVRLVTVQADITVRGTGSNATNNTSDTISVFKTFGVIPYPAPVVTADGDDGVVDLEWSAKPPLWADIDVDWSVQYKKSADTNWSDGGTVSTNSRRISGLDNDVPYDFRVRAHDFAGTPVRPDSPWSAVVSATPSDSSVSAVRNLALERTYLETGGTSAMAINFDPPARGAPFTRYEIRWRLQSGTIADYTAWTPVSDFVASRHTITGLTHGETYIVAVRAVNAGGNGVVSAIVATAADLPEASIDSAEISMVTQVGEAGSFAFSVTTLQGFFDGDADVAWSVDSGVGRFDTGGSTYRTADIGPGQENLSVTVEATITVRGAGGQARRGTTASVTRRRTFTVVPYPVPVLTGTPGSEYVDLAWNAAGALWSGIAVSWDVQRKLSSEGDSGWTQLGTVTTNSYRAAGLNNGTSYDFRVRAVDAVGSPITPDSPWSATVSGTPEADLGPPLVVDARGPYSGEAGERILFDGFARGGQLPYSNRRWVIGETEYAGDGISIILDTPGIFVATFYVTDARGVEASGSTTVTVTQSTRTTFQLTIDPATSIGDGSRTMTMVARLGGTATGDVTNESWTTTLGTIVAIAPDSNGNLQATYTSPANVESSTDATVVVSATRGGENASDSESFRVLDLVDPPAGVQNLMIEVDFQGNLELGQTDVAFDWDRPVGELGQGVRYNWRILRGGSAVQTGTTGATRLVVRNLSPGTPYVFEVTPFTDARGDGPSSTLNFTTLVAPAPGLCRNVDGWRRTRTSFRLRWTRPLVTSATAAATSYEYRWIRLGEYDDYTGDLSIPDRSARWSSWRTKTASNGATATYQWDESVLISGLVRQSLYRVQLRALAGTTRGAVFEP